MHILKGEGRKSRFVVGCGCKKGICVYIEVETVTLAPFQVPEHVYCECMQVISSHCESSNSPFSWLTKSSFICRRHLILHLKSISMCLLKTADPPNFFKVREF